MRNTVRGWDDASGYFLVQSTTFESACLKLKERLDNADRFENCTVE